MGKHLVEMTPQELNSFLVKKYNLGLNIFAFFIWASLFYNPKGDVTVSDLKAMKEKLLNLRSKILSVLKDNELLWAAEYTWDKFNRISRDQVVALIKNYKAGGIFNLIDDEIKIIDRKLNGKKQGSKKAGAPTKCRNLVFTLWSLLINSVVRKIDWEILADLLDWFWIKLKYYKCYERLKPTDEISDPEYLRNQFYRNKEEISKLFYVIMNWNFAGRIPWKKAKLTVVFGEKFQEHIYHSELHKKGLCHFANPEQISTYEAIIKKIGGQHNKNISISKSLEQEIEISKIHPDEMTKIYRYYVFRLYRNNPNFPPLIIFPDLSYLQ